MKRMHGLSGEYYIYEVGDMVRLVGVGIRWNGMQAKVVAIDGEYHDVVPVRFDHTIEVYRNQIEPWT